MLTVDQVKDFLGITSSDYDDFIENQEATISEAIEMYCGRKFTSTAYTQTFYKEDYIGDNGSFPLAQFPIITLTSVKEYIEGVEVKDITADIRAHYPTSMIDRKCGFFNYGDVVKVVFTAGYVTPPLPVTSVLLSLIQERYNKKKSGVDINFGSDVQSISIPGTISIAFDYSLQSNERKISMGTMLGNYVNILDPYRSERPIIGIGKLDYVV